MRVGVVLGAGGLVGQAFHLGVLSALHEQGFDAREADVLVGTSAGSLVAAGLRGGLSAPDLAAELTGEELSAEGRRIRAERRTSVARLPVEAAAASRRPLAPRVLLHAARRPWSVRPGSVAGALLPAGRVDTEPIARGIRQLHGDGWPERDLRICVVRTRDARRVVLGAPGAPPVDVGTAVAASCAIPAYFAPVRAAGETWVDGGMHSPSNADVVLDDALDLVVVVSPMTVARRRAGRPVDLGVRVAVRQLLASEVRRLRRTGARVVVLQPGRADLAVMGVNPMRGTRLDEVVAQAAASTRSRLALQPELVVG